MFRTRTDVDNHVRNVFRNIKLENERNLRCYNIAKLYYSVGDLYSARHYISTYLSVRPDHAGAHKVLGQAYEGLREKEKALEAYKRSLEIESKQPDLVLKVCELLLATNPYLSSGIAQYWLERAQEIQANHPVLFSLKKHILAGKGDGESPRTDDLELLIKKEIDLRPKDVNLQIHLLKLFMETNRKDVAYKHAIELETVGCFRKEIVWYQCLSDVMKAYKESVPRAVESGEFHVHNVGVLLQQVALLSSQDSQHVPGHSQSLFDLDQALFEANEVLKKKKERLLEECVRHASSQLCLHLGIALLRAGKQSRLGWREYVKQAQPVLLLAAMPRVDVTPVVSKKEAIQKRIKLWEVEKAYCRSQAGHVVLAMVKDGVNQFLNRVNQFCCLGWREKLYQRIFSTAAKEKEFATSFFVNYDGFDDLPGSLPSPASLSSSDILSQQLFPESLHHLVWLGLQNWAAQSKKNEYSLDHGLESPLSGFRLSRDFSCTVFEKLQWSTGNLKWSGTESLSRLDVDAFLYASVFCAASSLKRQREKGLSTEERPSVLPADITDPLCSPEQSRWWSMAWQMHSGVSTKSVSSPSYGEMRALIQRGLEVIRVLGNHGVDVKVIVLLAKTFEDKASSLSAHFDESSKAAQLDARAHVYWTTALALLERMDKSEMIHMADNRLFRFEGDELSRTEVKTLLEEGRFFMACRLMRAEQYEEAAQSFTQLKSPYASFYQALMYKKMADNVIGDMKSENITSDMRSNHSILLLKARAALHLTLDRVRAPHMHPCHPLNLELSQHLDDVEGQLAHIELNMMNRNACDGTSDDSASSRNSAEEGHHSHTITSSSVVENGGGLKKSFQCSTPVRSRRNVQEKQEARPSPERLDAQLRHLTSTNDTLLQSVLEQNRAILASNKGILEALEKNQKAVQDMQSRISTLQDEMSRLKLSDEMQQIRQEIAKLKMSDIRATSLVRDDKDEELYVFGDDEAAEELGATSPHFPVTYQNPYQQPLASNVQGAGAVRRNVYPAAQPIVPPLLPHNFFPQTQVPVGVGRNVDTASMLYSQNLMSCYSALGLPFDGLQQTPQQPQVPDYSSTPTLVSLLYGNQQTAAVAAQPAPSNVVRPQFTQMPMMPFGSPAVNIRPPTLIPPTPTGVAPAQPADLSTPSEFAFDTAPHNYQISMPAQATIPSAASVEKNLSPLQPISTSALLKDVPSPVYSAVTTPAKPGKQFQSPGERQGRTSICSEDGSYAEETECEGDFTPLIPLPEEVTVTTGEENETVLFDERAKLYRYVGGEWKERGIGQMKVLQHRDTKKSRILMRRDQVHKICANHQITADIEFSKHSNSENSLIWFAQDYAEEVVNLEKFCVRFKTPEQTARFQRVCEEARELNKMLVTPTKASLPTVAFSSTTTMTPASSTPSFAFKIQPSNSLFSTPLQSMASWNSSPAAAETPTAAASTGSGNDSNVEEYNPSINYTPVIPLPDEVPVVTGEENEKVLFSNRAKLCRFVEGQWKDRGVGDIKILEHKESGRMRLLMRRDQTHKVCANHTIVADMELQPLGNNKNQWIWCAPDFAEEVVNIEKLCVKFKTEDEGLAFKKAFDEARELSKVAKSPTKPPAVTSTPTPAPAKPWAPVLFGQPATFGSESTGEKVTLGGFTLSCKAAVKPTEEVGKSETDSVAQAKPNPFSGVNFSSAAAPVFGSSKVDAMPSFSSLASSAKSSDAKETAAPDQRPLSEIFKPKAGSWSCPGCYTTNTTDICPCCNTAKPGTEAASPAAKPNLFSGTGGAQFSFGIPQASKTETASSTTGLFGGTSAAKTQTANVSSAVAVAPIVQAAGTPKSSADNRPLSELFKPKEGAWSCPACYASNTAERTSCICCESPKPGCEGKPEGPMSKVDLSTGGQTFNFGIPCGTQGSPAAAAAAAVSTFAFGSSTITAPNPVTKKVLFNLPAATPTYSFGIPPIQDEAKCEGKPKDAGYVFGASSVTTSSSNPPAGNTFSFGSSSFGFNFEGVKNEKSPIKSPGKDATSGEEGGESDCDEDHDHLQYKPIIPLPEKVAVVTGEEDETVLYSHHAKLYRYSTSGKEWKERGTGAVKILRHHADGRLRLLMRRDQVYKLCLNHFLTPDIEFTARDPKSWTWSAPDFSEGEVETSMFAIRFKAPEIASDFKSAIDKALINYASPGKKQADKGVEEQCSTHTSEKSGVARVLFKESTSAPSGDDEIEIVYETSVSPEEREAALKLKLPANFYCYLRAPPCKGCAGCEKDEDESEQPGKEKPSPAVTLSFSNAAGDTASKAAVPIAQSFWNAASPSKPVNFSFGLSNNFSSPSSTTIFGGKTQIGSSAAPATGSIFGGAPSTTSATTIFGGATSVTPIFGAAATTTTMTTTSSTPTPATIFGGATSVTPIFGAAATTTTMTTTSSTPTPATIFGGATSVTPIFGAAATTTTITTTSSTPATIFGGATSVTPIFGAAATTTTITTTSSTHTPATIFGGATSVTPIFGAAATTTTSSTPIFGGSGVASSQTQIFGKPGFSFSTAALSSTNSNPPADSNENVTSNAAPTFGSAASNAPSFGSLPSTVTSSATEDDAVPFLPVDSSLSFAAVAQASTITNALTTQEPNKAFQFAGAGSQVFGVCTPKTDKSKNKAKKDDGESSGDEGDCLDPHDAHDPQFKPIIPLPDAIEVRTGEEDEEKVFCERGKVYRYADKEWKERGVGEMKILFHPARNSYRLLLRREQVHKVVLNQPLTADVELSPMAWSETSWCWGGMNYAEEPDGNLEKLAVRFKNAQLAKNFKETLESCQERSRLNTSASADQGGTDVIEESANSASDEINPEENPYQSYDYYVDPADVVCYENLFEETGALEENYDGSWKPIGEATATLFIDSTGSGSIVVKKGDTVVCQTAQSEDDIYTVNGNYFEWTSFDLRTGSHRILRINFPSEGPALEFKTKLEGIVPIGEEIVVEEDEDEEEVEEEEEEEEEDEDVEEEEEWQREE